MKNFEQYRSKLNLDGPLFLNYAAISPLTSTTTDLMHSEVSALNKSLLERYNETIEGIEKSRNILGGLLNTNAKNLAFTLNTSSALSTLALGLHFNPGDIVLVPDNEFPTNFYPWLNLKSKGVECRKFSVKDHQSIVESLKSQDLARVRLISISAVSYETGRLYELNDFVNFCKENHIYSCIDAIQAVGATPIDINKVDPDFLASGSQKWLMASLGCGYLYSKAENLSKLSVPFVGWLSHKNPEKMSMNDLEFSDDMKRFETGPHNYLPILALGSSIKEMEQVGWENIYSKITDNTNYVRNGLKSLGFDLLSDHKNLFAGITSFIIPNEFSNEQILESYHQLGISITSRKNYVRVSPHFFTLTSELDRFLSATEQIFKKKNTATPPGNY